MTFRLEDAEQALIRQRDQITLRWYPRYHLAPQAGWMNDPNGLVWFDGWYHAFYQHHPYSTQWGPMHWGHARSLDMVNWEHLPVALAPEGPEDKDGCFSGSAVVNGDELALVYTGHKFHGDPSSDDNLYQVQCLATSRDGIHFSRQGQVLDTPAGLHHFRDPKVWREGRHWYMVVGAREAHTGQVRLYRSDDLHRWEDAGILAEAPPHLGFMWECPDFFTLAGKQILLMSPQGIQARGYDHRNLFQSGYIVGHWQPGTDFTQEGDFTELDRGHDFYAPQTFVTPDGRRMVMAWMNTWESAMPEQQDGWCGMLTLPRELTLTADHRLQMTPAREVECLRQRWHPWPAGRLKNQQQCVMENCETSEVLVSWNRATSDAEQYGISLSDGLRLYVDSQSQRLVLARHYPLCGLSGERSVALPAGDTLSLRIFFDRSSVEVFVNDGDACLTSRIFPGQRQLSLFAWSGSADVTACGAWDLA
ncbi:glycoside hydrolase family 32 protein [Erwinia persicina]|uniref:glycoside hydrolase family 32 protein n=1 Tax=Erwinia persicina TaxID=55211 RepID=UPI0021071783|nr:glycoside hydrolase family 32 protein [Erwinia persicina]MCQ4104833.1 glycoside hydrolase family 32 protein [Erwinia persicina]UTX14552.1 glycoside hydrolase family 32 protein [Erwinia persicina]